MEMCNFTVQHEMPVTFFYFFLSFSLLLFIYINNRIRKIRISLLDICIRIGIHTHIIFLITIYVWLLRLLSVIRILGNEFILFFWAFLGILRLILNDFEK
jgi:hypothetical protein